MWSSDGERRSIRSDALYPALSGESMLRHKATIKQAFSYGWRVTARCAAGKRGFLSQGMRLPRRAFNRAIRPLVPTKARWVQVDSQGNKESLCRSAGPLSVHHLSVLNIQFGPTCNTGYGEQA